DYYCQSHVLF
nr:immunoglobulin light chain junction region [Macaca mulatta]